MPGTDSCASGKRPISASTNITATHFNGSHWPRPYWCSMQSLAANPQRTRKRSRRTLWLLLAVCAAPAIASYIAYNFWRPTSHMNYGTLLEPHPLPDAQLVALDGKALRLADLKGEWVLLTSASPDCNITCRERLVYMRQVR